DRRPRCCGRGATARRPCLRGPRTCPPRRTCAPRTSSTPSRAAYRATLVWVRALRVADGRSSLVDIREPSADGEVLVRVTLSGICNTDLELERGYAGFRGTIGHEFVGVADGKRVVGEINAGCGTCARCVAGDPRHCPTRTVLGIVG